ncbi:MAG TPA: hypothetical protein VGU73_09525 [Acidimicrobiia bacterium]|nr:hypothetical protein [Acidimicrobiia bacterium]
MAMAPLAACGGGGPSGKPLTDAQLVTRVDAQCLTLAAAGNDLVAAQDPSAQGAQLSGFLHSAARVLRTHSTAIGQLVPPASLQSDLSQFVSALGSYADQLDALAGRVRSGETYEQLLTNSASQVSSLNHLSDQANHLAAKLNFKDCAT